MITKQEHKLPPEPPEYKDRYIILIIVLSAIFMGVFDTNVVNLAMPWLTASFGVDLNTSQWVITAYLVANTSLLLIFGRLSEITGKSKLFIAGIALFTISSLACGLANGIYELILFRVIQGIGASIVFSINMAMVIQSFPRNERGKAVGFVGTTVALGSIAGPIVGGFIVGTVGWQYIFFINVPVGIVLIIAALKYLKRTEERRTDFDMDWIGAGTIVTTVVSLIMLLNSLADCREFTMPMYVYLGLFIISGAVFVYTELKHKNPIVDLTAFKIKSFTFANLSTLINFIAFSMFILTLPFYMEIVLEYDSIEVGKYLLIVPAILAVVSPLSGWIYDRYQSTYHSSLGMLIMAAGMFGVSYAVQTANIWIIMAFMGVFGLGTGLFTSPNNTEVMSSLPPHKTAIASSTLATVRNFGNIIGVSVASILLYIILRSCGFAGQMIYADPQSMIQATSTVFVVAGGLCFIGVFTSLMLRHGRKSVEKKS